MTKDLNVSPKPVLNPILLWKILHGWEDPSWGHSEMGQLTIISSIHELAGQITDSGTREKLKAITAAGLTRTAGAVAQAKV